MAGNRYGSAGKSLSGDGAVSKYGKSATRAGARGERRLSHFLSKSPATKDYPVWQSLRIPSGSGKKRYNGDVDMALANGTRVILVDCKMWAGGKVYWTFLGMPMCNFTPMKEKMSQNMELAVARYREALPGHRVEGIVVFVPTNNGRLPAMVSLLRWPGGIKSYLTQDGINKIASFLGPVTDVSPRAAAVLGSQTK